MKIGFTDSIGFKTAAALALVLTAVTGIFSYNNVRSTEKRFLEMAGIESTKMSNSIISGLEHAMLRGNLDMAQDIISTVGQQSMVESIRIISPDGQIKLSRDKAEIGRNLDRTKEKSCSPCHSGKVTRKDRNVVLFENGAGVRILRNANPIMNKKECYSCHNPKDRIRGILLVDFTMKDADNTMSGSRKMLIMSALASLMSSIVIIIFLMRKLVARPLVKMLRKMEEVEKGNLDAVVEVTGKDEIAQLGKKFNNMVSSMKVCQSKIIDEHLNERLTLFNISEILDRSGSFDEASRLIVEAVNIGFGVDECTIMSLKDTGGVHLNEFVGLSKEKSGLIRDYMDSIFRMDDLGPAGKIPENDRHEIRVKLMSGEPFVVKDVGTGLGDFLLVPLKSSKRLVGAITVHRIKGKEIREIDDTDEIRKLFQIISTQVSPYLFIGLCMDEKRMMKVSPFSCFLDLISEHIDRVREYNGFVSLAVIKVENYKELCDSLGVDKASLMVQEAGSALSSAIDMVHDATRITEIKIVLILPMTDKVGAAEIINKAIAVAGKDVVLSCRVVSYPDDGNTPIQLMYLSYA